MLAIILAVLLARPAEASIIDFKNLDIDFRNADNATAKATWSESAKLAISADGLGWDGDPAAFREGWIQSVPMPLGLSWRPPSWVSVSVSIFPEAKDFGPNNGQKSNPHAGDVYVRYSPDLVHWSTWQVVQSAQPETEAEKQKPGRYFRTVIQVPKVEQEEYAKLLAEYARLDVPWGSDEDAAVRWILKSQPDFFAKHLPFIGYIQFRYEVMFPGGQRLTSFKALVAYVMGGFHSIPKDKDAYKDRDSKPWSFKAEQASPAKAAK